MTMNYGLLVDMKPGQVLRIGPERGTLICLADHPRGDGWVLAVWRLADGTISADCMSRQQHFEWEEITVDDRARELLTALGESGRTLGGVLSWPSRAGA